jgi:hypothetical protein
LSHQRGKRKTKENIPSSNAIQFQSHQKKKKMESGDDCPAEAAAHLAPTVSQLLLQALFIANLRSELYTHLAQQALFI